MVVVAKYSRRHMAEYLAHKSGISTHDIILNTAETPQSTLQTYGHGKQLSTHTIEFRHTNVLWQPWCWNLGCPTTLPAKTLPCVQAASRPLFRRVWEKTHGRESAVSLNNRHTEKKSSSWLSTPCGTCRVLSTLCRVFGPTWQRPVFW
jgi:hypothetical protein